MNGRVWARAAIIRAIRTFAQTALATIGTQTVFTNVDWKFVGSTALLAGIVSMLMSITGLPEVNNASNR